MVRNEKKGIRYFDFFLLLLILVIFTFSLLVLATIYCNPISQGSGFWATIERINFTYPRLHLQWFALGLALFFGLQFIDYKLIGSLISYAFWGCMGLMLVTALLGSYTLGAVAWFKLTDSSRAFQPSEFGKIAFIVFLAHETAKRAPITRVADLLVPLAILAVPVVIQVVQKDLGTGMVYVAIFIGVLFASGTSMKLLVGLAGVGIVSLIPIYFMLAGFQLNRINTFLGINNMAGAQAVDSASEHVKNAMIAIGSGKAWGKGLFGESLMTQQKFVPFIQNDSIIAAVGEAMGFAGCMLLIGLYILLLLHMFTVAIRTQDVYGKLIVVGVASMFFFHVFEYVSMNVGTMPMTGIPLPLFSYGGSSMLSVMISLGLVANVYMRGRKTAHSL